MKRIALFLFLSSSSMLTFGQSITLDPKTNSQASLTVSDIGNSGLDMPRIFGQRALGTVSIPLAVTNGVDLFSIFGNGYKGSSYGSGASIRFIATENWTSSASGGGITFGTQDNGSVFTLSEKMRINHNGNVGIGTPDPSTKLEVAGSFSISGTTILRGSANNFNLNGKSVVHVIGGGSYTLTGIAGGVEGMIVHIIVPENSDLILANASSLSLSDNHIKTGSNADITISQGGGATLIYDNINNDWRVIGIKN